MKWGSLVLLGVIGYFTYDYVTSPSDEKPSPSIQINKQGRVVYHSPDTNFSADTSDENNRQTNKQEINWASFDSFRSSGTRNQPAPMIGVRAGLVSVDLEDPLIGKKNKYKGIRIAIPRRIPDRYKDTRGR